MISSEEKTKLKQFYEPQSTIPKIEAFTSDRKVTGINCKEAFPKSTFPIKTEMEGKTVGKTIVDVPLN